MANSAVRFSRRSSVLIVGAHPDDAVRACGGVMLRALASGAKVAVIAVTDGAALFGKEGIPDGRKTAAARRAEQVSALETLGVPMHDVLFLGFPDGGLAKLRHRHHTERSGAYFCPWLAADRTGDESCVPGISFTARKLTEQLWLQTFYPRLTHVFTHHLADKHPDHRAATWFVRRALSMHLRGTPPRNLPPIFEYLTYLKGTHWPPAGASVPLDAARALGFPGRVVDFRLGPDEISAKDRALDCFVPILGDAYIDNWRRTNEVFWRSEENR